MEFVHGDDLLNRAAEFFLLNECQFLATHAQSYYYDGCFGVNVAPLALRRSAELELP